MPSISKILLPALTAALTFSTMTSASSFTIARDGTDRSSTYTVAVDDICGCTSSIGGFDSGHTTQPTCGGTLEVDIASGGHGEGSTSDDSGTPVTYYSGDESCNVGCSFADIDGPGNSCDPFA